MASTAGSLVVNFNAPTAPANNAFPGTTVTVPTTVAALTTLATTQVGEPTTFTCDGFSTTVGKSVWYTLTPPASSVVTIDTFGSNFDTVLAVFTGSSVAALTQVACNDELGTTQQSQVSFVASGAPYRVQVSGYLSDFGELLVHFGNTPNDSFSSAYLATALQLGEAAEFNQLTNAATTEAGEPTTFVCGSVTRTIGKTVWYAIALPSFSAMTTNNVQIDTIGSGFDTILAVYTGSTVGGLTQVACNDDTGGLQSQVQINAASGTRYYVQVGGYNGASGSLVVNFSYLPPQNDTFASVGRILNIPVLFGEPTYGATTDAGEPAPSCAAASGKSVWYALWNTTETPLLVTTVYSNFDTVLAVYTSSSNPGPPPVSAPPINTLSQIACSDDSPGSLGSTLTFTVAPSTWYYVQMSGYSGDWGNLYPLFLATPPTNDNFAQGKVVSAPGPRGVYNVGATTEPGEPTLLSCGGSSIPIGRSVWYRYTPGARAVTINTFTTNFDTVLAVYTSPTASLNNLTQVACNDDAASTLQSQVNFTGTAGTTYYVQVGGLGSGLSIKSGTLVVNFN